jgi:L-aspartate semialdehyde sulfurtransferase
MAKSIAQINAKIKKGEAIVVTKEEMLEIVKEKGIKQSAKYVDVVTTGTFGPMCSSMAVFNIGHANPKIKIQKSWLNDVECYSGLAAVDMIIGAAQLSEKDPANSMGPGRFKYGGGHVIEDLVAGKDLRFKAQAYGTDCYPRKELETLINIKDINQATLVNPRNCYQNYNVAVNLSKKVIHTYMGVLRPKMANASYCSAGQLSPLLNDPYFRTIGIGSRIFLGGGIGYVFWHGTQHSTDGKRTKGGVPYNPLGTLAVNGDLKQMSPEWVRGASLKGYGVSLALGMGIPIPIIDEAMASFAAVKDKDIFAPIVDYSEDYPNCKNNNLGYVSYRDLKTGHIEIKGKQVPTAGLSSYFKARQICQILKEKILKGDFILTQPVAALPSEGSGMNFKLLKMRSIK